MDNLERTSALKTTLIGLLFLLLLVANSYAAELIPLQQQAGASPVITIPVITNAPGALGGVFKTKVVVFNPTISSFPVEVSLYGTNGFVAKPTISLTSRHVRNDENCLAEVFSYTGAGTVNFDSLSLPGGNTNLKFLVSAEVFIDSPNGRFKTVVSTGAPLDPVSPTGNAYSIGITVDADNRTNLGCFNTSFSTNVISADLYNSANQLVTTVAIDRRRWRLDQVGLANSVAGGYIRWRPGYLRTLTRPTVFVQPCPCAQLEAFTIMSPKFEDWGIRADLHRQPAPASSHS